MSKKLIWILAVLLAAVLLLSACERSAVTPQSQATPTVQTTGGQSTVALPDAYKTQTAAGTVTALVMTMQPGGPIATPTGGTPTPTATLLGGATLTPTNTTIPTTGGNPSAPTPTPGRPATYTLQSGEHPYCIARRFNVDQDELLTANGLTTTEADNLPVGYILQIPQTGNPFVGTRALNPHPATYTVQVNDTIYSIACHFGDVDPIYLAAYNNIVPPYVIQTGRVLSIP
ncbi:MAG: LysM peptidoglycan-binding domain-containing protein [Chloroflexi bacterium]|nr:LysM peptidoglycan-binding domain-containing protein [Chloroflexota bacterium]